MLSFLILLLSIAIMASQVALDRRTTALSPHILFQVYFIIQLPLNLFLGTNYYLPRFDVLSPLTSAGDTLQLGVLILVAQVVFVATVYMIEIRPAASVNSIATWPRTRVNIICAGLFATGYLAFFTLIYINGGVAAFAAVREVWRTAGVSGQGWVLFPATTLPAVAMCAVMIANRDQFTGQLGAIKLLMLYVLTAFPASQLGFRALIFLPLLQVGFFYHTFIRHLPGKYIFVGAIVVMFSFTLYGIQREIPYKGSYGSYLEYLNYVYISRPDITYTVVLRSMGADVLQRVVDHMERFGEYIRFYPALFEALTIPIPSSIWPGKPLPLSVLFSRNIFGIEGGVSPTIVGEGYWHGGLAGVVVIMVIIGLLHAYFRSLQRRSETDMGSALLMLSIYPSLVMMAEAFQGYFNGIVLIAIANWLIRRMVGRNQANPVATEAQFGSLPSWSVKS